MNSRVAPSTDGAFPAFKIIRSPRAAQSVAATFDAFIESLDPWETDLLRHSYLNVDPYSVCLYTPAISSSERWIRPENGPSILRVDLKRQGERVAERMGPTRGGRVHLYRAEVCGILAFLRFLIRISHFTQMHEPWHGILATDCQSVLDTLFGHDAEEPTADTGVNLDNNQVILDVLCPKWDILIQI